MVKHIIIWTLKEEYSNQEKEQIKKEIKEGLEGLYGTIGGLSNIKVYTDRLESSTGDLMLDSTFESIDALNNYAKHPAPVEVANTKVRPFVSVRSCLDFEL